MSLGADISKHVTQISKHFLLVRISKLFKETLQQYEDLINNKYKIYAGSLKLHSILCSIFIFAYVVTDMLKF